MDIASTAPSGVLSPRRGGFILAGQGVKGSKKNRPWRGVSENLKSPSRAFAAQGIRPSNQNRSLGRPDGEPAREKYLGWCLT